MCVEDSFLQIWSQTVSKFNTITIAKNYRDTSIYCTPLPERCLLAYRSECNAFFRDLPGFFLLTVKSINLVVAHDGFQNRLLFFIEATLIAEILFK